MSTRGHAHRPSRLAIDQPHIFDDQAFWFLSLPNKIKRHQFSREEQVILTERCESALRDRSYGSNAESSRPTRTTKGEHSLTLIPRKQVFGPSATARCDHCSAIITTVQNSWHWMARENKRSPETEQREIVASTQGIPTSPQMPSSAIVRPIKRSFRRSFSLKPVPLPAPTLLPPS